MAFTPKTPITTGSQPNSETLPSKAGDEGTSVLVPIEDRVVSTVV